MKPPGAPSTRAGDLLREARIGARIGQHELAKRCGTAQSAISRIECGRISPTVDTLDRLIRATGAELHLTIRPKEH